MRTLEIHIKVPSWLYRLVKGVRRCHCGHEWKRSQYPSCPICRLNKVNQLVESNNWEGLRALPSAGWR